MLFFGCPLGAVAIEILNLVRRPMPKITLAELRSTTAHDLLNRSFQPRKMLLDPWLRTEESCIIWAASGVGKTMLSLSLALAVSGGGKLGDWNAENPCRVLYVDGEMHLQDVKDRLVALSGQKQGILRRSQISERSVYRVLSSSA
ncbi:MAG: AAA family ATPase [Yoonia sp.]